MARNIPAAKRIELAREKIQEAREIPVPFEGGRSNFFDVRVALPGPSFVVY